VKKAKGIKTMSYKINLNRGFKSEDIAVASSAAGNTDIEVLVDAAKFTNKSDVAHLLRLAARRIEDSDHPAA
jgi:hypothetical protein